MATQDLLDTDCELLLLSSEPFPFKQKHVAELKESLDIIGLADIKITLVDGEMFSWYGSHLLNAPRYFKELHRSMVNSE